MALSKRLRYEILHRDGFRCRYCGITAAECELTIDHVVPQSLGGRHEPSNLVAACMPCNTGKAASNPSDELVADVDERAVRWADALKQAAILQSRRRDSRDAYVSHFDDAWSEWTFGDAPGIRPPNWRQSVTTWHDVGLDLDTLISLVDDVMPRRIPNARIWRYFCGAVWNVIRERESLAREILEETDAAPHPFD